MSYTPKKLKEFVGQKRVVAQVSHLVAAGVRRKEPLPHILISGPAGTGKTTLAKIIAAEVGQPFSLATPAAIKTNPELFSFFDNNLSTDGPSIIFLDEVHRLPIQVEEDFYLPMENRLFIRKGQFESEFEMPPWTLIAATTLPGKLSNPLFERFGLHLMMAKYGTEDMEQILVQIADYYKVKYDGEAIIAIAWRSRANPRVANHLFDRCMDTILVSGKNRLTTKVADETFAMLGIDEWGLNDLDRKYLSELYKADRSIGVNSLVPVLDVDKDTIQNTIEPYLLESGLILLTVRGRQLTPLGRAYVESKPEVMNIASVGPMKAKQGNTKKESK